MFMTSSYELFDRDGDVQWCCYLAEEEHCPECGGILAERDRRKRIIRYLGGGTGHIIVRRMYCPACGRLHTELPDVLLPYKHYEAKVIEAVLDGEVGEEDPRAIEGPTIITMRMWNRCVLNCADDRHD